MATVENNNKSGAIKIAGYLEKKRRKVSNEKWYYISFKQQILLKTV